MTRRETATSRRPNILWICTDQQRWDTIGAAGNTRIDTPNLDRLVRSGVAFDRAYAQSTICTPSRASFMTGRYPAAVRVQRNGNDYFPPEETLVTRLLADSGYYCGLVGKLHLSCAEGRVEQRPDDGYEEFHWSHHPRPDWPEGNAYTDWLRREHGVADPEELFRPFARKLYGEGLPEELHQTTWCGDVACEFVRRRAGRGPWLLSVNPFAPHPPFLPPAALLRDADADAQADAATVGKRVRRSSPGAPSLGPVDHQKLQLLSKIDHQRAPADGDTAPVDSVDAARMRACYHAEIELIDKQIGRLLSTLEETGQLEDTIVVFMSDHGDMLGDHGLLLKGARLYDPLVRVPLIISWPAGEARRWPAQGSGWSSALVELVDVAPTLLEAAGIDPPSGMQGRSLLPLLRSSASERGASTARTEEALPNSHKEIAVAEYYDALDLPNASHVTMTFDGRYKCIVTRDVGLVEVYDHENDPEELADLWPRLKGTELGARTLRRHLEAYMATVWPGPERTGAY